jgi:hypothetical protein
MTTAAETRTTNWIVLADRAGLLQRSAGGPGPEIPGEPVEPPLQQPDESPFTSPEEHPDSRPQELPDAAPDEIPPERRGST